MAGRAGVYFPGLNGRGGAEWLAVMTALELARTGRETFVFTDGPVPAELEADLGCDLSPITVVELGAPHELGGLRGLQRLRELRAHRDAMRAHRLEVFVNAKFKSQLPGCGRRNFYYCHFPHRIGVATHGTLRRLYVGLLDAVERVAVDRTRRGFLATYDEVWANSEFTAHHVERQWGTRPRIVYPPCEAVPALEKRREIVVIGRFQPPTTPDIPYKAQDYLLATFAGLRDLHGQGWRLVLVGGARDEDADYVADLRRAAEGLPVDLVVNATRDQLRQALGRASIYWHAQGVRGDAERVPHSQEHFGISTVEAMSAGVIPLVYGTAGPLEVVRGVDGLEPWHDRAELEALTRAWASAVVGGSPDVETMRDRCRARAAHFDLAHFAQRLRDAL
jgi:glycosyltransferase involved in cell wall biosynthesis